MNFLIVSGLSQLAYRELMNGVHSRLASIPGGFGPGHAGGFPLGFDAAALSRGFTAGFGGPRLGGFPHGLGLGGGMPIPGADTLGMRRDVNTITSNMYVRDRNFNAPPKTMEDSHRMIDDHIRALSGGNQRRPTEEQRPFSNDRPQHRSNDPPRAMETEPTPVSSSENRFNMSDSNNTSNDKTSIVYDVASLILYRCTALPIRLKIPLDRLFSAMTHEEVTQVLNRFGWSYEDYSRGYKLQVNINYISY